MHKHSVVGLNRLISLVSGGTVSQIKLIVNGLQRKTCHLQLLLVKTIQVILIVC